MAGQKGRDVLIRIADGQGGYETLAGIRTTKLELSASRVDATSADSAEAWRELMTAAGTKSARISGAGVFKDATSDIRMRTVFFGAETPDWQFVVPDLGTISGPFMISALSWSGRHDGEAEFAVMLESAGQIQFAAA
ncbi:MAG: phage major tail protein, TP901-1 family [Hyphomonadaceae bacterium]|nr:phage major tail protein, TP901-1 family [Hyphomonadaceae bacterium]